MGCPIPRALTRAGILPFRGCLFKRQETPLKNPVVH